MNPEKIALFDMDGTLCDFTGQIMRDLTLLRSPNEPEVTIASIFDPPEWLDRRMTLIKNVRGWWKNLPRLEDGFRILDLAVQIGFTPQVLTKGPFRTSIAWEEKYIWCREQIDAVGHTKKPIDITITMDKAGTYGTMLVEDFPPYVDRWLTWRKRGLVILVDRPYNQGYEHPQVVRFDGSLKSEGEIRERMLAAYSRDRT
jgi:hypothetical protein